jgi:hypothetical protein
LKVAIVLGMDFQLPEENERGGKKHKNNGDSTQKRGGDLDLQRGGRKNHTKERTSPNNKDSNGNHFLAFALNVLVPSHLWQR